MVPTAFPANAQRPGSDVPKSLFSSYKSQIFCRTLSLLPNSIPNIKEGHTSCVAMVAHHLQRIEGQKHLNAFVEVYADEALARATRLDDSGAPRGKLHEVVIGIKDVICYKHHKVTVASKILEGFTSPYSATTVERVLAEGAIIIGRLNCDEFEMGLTNENSVYSKVLNAADESRISRGFGWVGSGGAGRAMYGIVGE